MPQDQVRELARKLTIKYFDESCGAGTDGTGLSLMDVLKDYENMPQPHLELMKGILEGIAESEEMLVNEDCGFMESPLGHIEGLRKLHRERMAVEYPDQG